VSIPVLSSSMSASVIGTLWIAPSIFITPVPT
jgi:hypothetical protein